MLRDEAPHLAEEIVVFGRHAAEETVRCGFEDVELGAGESVTVLKEWQNHYLVKNGEGNLFNVPKSAVEK